MKSTKGKMNVLFETIANDQTFNADLRAKIAAPWPYYSSSYSAGRRRIR
jgi:hypothetical protein